jgi:hypothetical protein
MPLQEREVLDTLLQLVQELNEAASPTLEEVGLKRSTVSS